MNAYVKRGRGYGGLAAFAVENPDSQRFIPGRTVSIHPAHEEAEAWRAILAGFTTEDNPVLVPLAGHFGELVVKKISPLGANSGGMSLALDEPFDGTQWARGDEVSWTAARVLALSTALTFNLEGRA